MNNALIFLEIAIIDFTIVLLAWKAGTHYLIATIIANAVMTSIFVNKLIPIFGFNTTAGEAFYASIYIATDILTEHEGKQVSYQSIWMGFVGQIMLIICSMLALQFTSAPETANIADAMVTLFTPIPRIVTASFISYLISQRFNIWFYRVIKIKTSDKKLWLRNDLGTITSLAIDSLVFFPLAFLGSVSTETLLTLICTGWIFKVPLALIDTPFIYFSYWIKGMTPPDFRKE
ncbi:MAG: queuosine precursor transporter [Patescibacteria group bacterium]